MSKMYKVIVFSKEELDDIKDRLDYMSEKLDDMKVDIDGTSNLSNAKDEAYYYMDLFKKEVFGIKEKLWSDETWLS